MKVSGACFRTPSLYYCRNLVLEFSTKELAVQAGDMGDSHMLRAFHLAGAGVRAGTEAELVHLGDHGLGPLGTLDLSLRKQCEGTYTGGHEKHGRPVLAGCHTGAAAYAGSTVHALLRSLVGYEDGVPVRNTACTYRNEASGLENLVESLAVHDKVLDYRETLASPRLNRDGLSVLELAHVELAGSYLVVRSVSTPVDVERAGAADTLTAVMVERYRTAALAASLDSYRLHPLVYQLLVENVEHLKERAVRGNILDTVCLKMSFGLGVFLTPYS